VKGINPRCAVVAAEPVGATGDAADTAASKARGTLVSDMAVPDTIADGLKAKMGDLTWPIVRDKVDEVVTVEEGEIVAAMKLVFERMKLVVEPSGAVGLAAVLSPQFKKVITTIAAAAGAAAGAAGGGGGVVEVKGTERQTVKVGVVLCGGNLDMAALFAAYARP
jgi:serine racemase